MKEKNEKKKIKYNSIQNIIYVFRGIWELDRSLFFLLAIDTIFSGLQPLPLLFLPKYILDEITGNKDFNRIIQTVIILLSLWFICSIIKIQMNRINNRFISTRIGFMIRYGRKAMTMDFENLENPDVLDLASRAQRCLNSNQNGIEGIMRSIQRICNSIITLAGCIYIVFVMHPLLIIIIAVLLIANYLFRFKMERTAKKMHDAMESVNRRFGYLTHIMKNFSFGKDIRLFGMKNWLAKRHQDVMDEHYKSNSKINNMYYRYEQIYSLTAFFQEIALYVFLIWKAFNGMSIGDFALYAGIIRTFTGTLDMMFGQIAHISRQNLDICDYREFLEYPDRTSCDNHRVFNAADFDKCEFSFQNVSFKYPNRDEYALKNVNLKIKARERLAIVGLNGAGKSTFIKLLCRLYEPTEGVITLNGIDIREYDKSDYFKIFAVVFQDIHIFAFTLAENISMKEREETDDDNVIKSLSLAGLFDKVTSLKEGIETNMLKVIEDNGLELSGGETQKLVLARALYKNSPVMILDEPTAALDALAEYNLYKKFNDMIEKKTSIYISHRLASTRFCDNIALFDHGQITDCGTHDELLSKGGLYAKMFNMQARYYKEGKAYEDSELERILEEEVV